MASLKFRIFKWTIIFSLILLVVVSTGLGYVVYNIEDLIRQNKDQILSQVSQSLDRDITAEDLSVSIWSGFGVELTEVEIADDADFSAEPFLTAHQVILALEFWPILQGDFQISDFYFNEPKIRLIKNADGIYNVSTFGAETPSSSVQQISTRTVADENNGSSGSSEIKVSVDSFKVNQGFVVYEDQSKNETYQFDKINLVVNDFSFENAFPTELSLALYADQPNLHFKGTVGPIEALRLDGQLQLDDTPISQIKKIDGINQALPENYALDGSLSIKSKIEGTLAALQLQPEVNATQLSISNPGVFEKKQGETLVIASQTNYTAESVKLDDIRIQLKNVHLTGNTQVPLQGDQGITGEFQSEPFELTSLHEMVPKIKQYDATGQATIQFTLDTQQSNMVNGIATLQDVNARVETLPKKLSQINGQVQFTTSNLSTQNLKLDVGQSHLTVNADVISFDPIETTYVVQSERVLMSDVAFGFDESTDSFSDLLVDGKATVNDRVQATGAMQSQAGNFYGFRYETLKGNYQFANQIVNANNVNFKTLNGEIDAKITYNMAVEPPTFEVSTQAKQIDVVELFRQKVFNLPEALKGSLDFDVDLSGAGKNWDTLKNTLKGNGKAVVLKGEILGVNLPQNLMDGLERMPMIANFTNELKQNYPAMFNSSNTLFDKLELNATMEGSKINLEPVVLAAAEWAVSGEGSYDLDRGITSDAILKLSQGLSGFLTSRVKELRFLTDQDGNVAVPFTLRGPLDRLQYSPNQEVVTGLIQNAVAGNVLQAVLGEDDSPVSNILKNVFGGGSSRSTQQTPPTTSQQPIPSTDTAPEISAPRTIDAATPSLPAPSERLPRPNIREVIENSPLRDVLSPRRAAPASGTSSADTSQATEAIQTSAPRSSTAETQAATATITPTPKAELKPEEAAKKAVENVFKGLFGGGN